MGQQQRRRVSATEVQQQSEHTGHDHSHSHGHDGDQLQVTPNNEGFLGGLFGGGNVNHATGAEIDAFIQADDFFNYYIQSSFDREGNGADGRIVVLEGEAFESEWMTYAMARRNPATGELFTEAEARAFGVAAFEDNGRIVLHKRRGNGGTAIHESMHLFTHSSYVRNMGFNINEGTTEVFTRLLCSRVGIRRNGNYPGQFEAMNAVATGLDRGHNLLASAYFDGNYGPLREAMNAVPGRFDQFKALMDANNFTAAAALF